VPGALVAEKYRIIEELGRGGMGVVYKAEDTRLQRPVALKFLPHQWVSDPDARERFIQEARAASALDHPNVCSIYEIGETEDGRMYISMAYYEGESLREKIRRAPLCPEEAVDIALQVARGLGKAHGKGVVHRDIKPANILVTQDRVAKIVDFGLAKLAGQVKLTREGTTVGTVAYMSPEQAKGEAVDQRTDIWSLGVVLYEMLSGVMPFKGDYEQTLIHSILQDEPERLTKFRKALPAGLENIVFKALSKKPAGRYQTMEEMLEDLKAVADGLRPESGASLFLRGRILGIKKTHAYPALAVLVIAAVLGALFIFPKRGQAMDSIAVMPLENLSGDPDQDSLAESIHDDLITNLAGLSGLKTVIARRTVMRFKGKDTPPQQIAKDLRVKALVTGALRRTGDNVRVTAQLIDPESGSQVWAQSYEHDLGEINLLENEIVAAIAREVNLQLTLEEKSRLATARTVNPEAYVAYTKGKFYLNQLTPEGLKNGLDYMQQAIDKDPANPLPYAALALGYCRIGHSNNPPPDAFLRAKEAALKAEELGGTLAETEAALGQIKLFDEWDWDGGGKALQHALALNPSLADAQRMYSWYLLLIGRNDEAIAAMKRAIELDPLAPLWSSDLGWQYWSMGRNEEAMDAQQKALELNPKFEQALSVMSCLYTEKGMFEEAIAVQEKLEGVNPLWKLGLVWIYAHAGREAEGRKMLAELLEKGPKLTGAKDGWDLAEVYAALGDKDEAFRWIEAAVKEHNTFIPWMRQNPNYAPLRSDPRYEELVRYMKLPELK
jgi:serine/threonine protein kinase/tetratricopeptide (TPR) repeat protein